MKRSVIGYQKFVSGKVWLERIADSKFISERNYHIGKGELSGVHRPPTKRMWDKYQIPTACTAQAQI